MGPSVINLGAQKKFDQYLNFSWGCIYNGDTVKSYCYAVRNGFLLFAQDAREKNKDST